MQGIPGNRVGWREAEWKLFVCFCKKALLVPVRFPLAELCFLHEKAYFKNEKQEIIVKKENLFRT